MSFVENDRTDKNSTEMGFITETPKRENIIIREWETIMTFIQQLVNKYGLDEKEVMSEYAKHLIHEKKLPEAFLINLETLGLGQMEEKAEEIRTKINSVEPDAEVSNQEELSTGAKFARERNERDIQVQESQKDFWGEV